MLQHGYPQHTLQDNKDRTSSLDIITGGHKLSRLHLERSTLYLTQTLHLHQGVLVSIHPNSAEGHANQRPFWYM